jgi:hypothetical protein
LSGAEVAVGGFGFAEELVESFHGFSLGLLGGRGQVSGRGNWYCIVAGL